MSLRKQFEEQNFTIDFDGIRGISPSFAYRCFGFLYEDQENLKALSKKIGTKNDCYNLKSKVLDSIGRRIKILSSEKAFS